MTDSRTSNPLLLLPCPFCGGEANYEQIELERGTEDYRWSVGCRDEECIGFQALKSFARKVEAAEAWNKRHDLPIAADEIERLQHEMELIRRETWGSPWESAQTAHEIASRCLKRNIALRAPPKR